MYSTGKAIIKLQHASTLCVTLVVVWKGFLLGILLHALGVSATVTEQPENAVHCQNQKLPLQFSCRTDGIDRMKWDFYSSKKDDPGLLDLYDAYDVKASKADIYSVNRSHQFAGLQLKKISEAEAGTYICRDNDGGGKKVCAELVVITENLVGRTTKIDGSNKTEVCCSVKYAGNVTLTIDFNTTTVLPKPDYKPQFSKSCITVDLTAKGISYSCQAKVGSTRCTEKWKTIDCLSEPWVSSPLSISLPTGEPEGGLLGWQIGLIVGTVCVAVLATVVLLGVLYKKSKKGKTPPEQQPMHVSS